MNFSSRHRLSAALPLVCLCIAAGMCQYVEDSVDVGGAWVGSLVYAPEQDEIWGTTSSGSSTFAISCDSNKIVAAVPVHWAGDLALDSTDGKLYCAYYGPGQESLAVISVASRQVIKRLEMPGSTMPVWDPVSDRVYVSCQATNSVAVVDCASDSLLTYIPVGACPMKIYINTLRRKLYVLNFDAGTVSIVDMTTNQVIKTVDVGGTPNAGYYCRKVDKFYSGGEFRQCIVIGGQSDTIVARIALTGNVDVMAATGNEDDGLVYLGTQGDGGDYVAAVSAQYDSVLATTVIGRRPWGLAFYRGSGLLYCTSASTDEVCVLTSDGTTILTTLPVGDCPFVFAVAPRHNRLYLGHLNTKYVYVLKDTSAGRAETWPPRRELRGALSVAPNPFTQSVTIVWNSLGKGGDVARVYAQDGRLVKQVQIPAGETRWVWDGRDDSGLAAPSAVYVVGAGTEVRSKIIKLK